MDLDMMFIKEYVYKYACEHIHVSFGTKTLLFFIQILARRNIFFALPEEMLSHK